METEIILLVGGVADNETRTVAVGLPFLKVLHPKRAPTVGGVPTPTVLEDDHEMTTYTRRRVRYKWWGRWEEVTVMAPEAMDDEEVVAAVRR